MRSHKSAPSFSTTSRPSNRVAIFPRQAKSRASAYILRFFLLATNHCRAPAMRECDSKLARHFAGKGMRGIYCILMVYKTAKAARELDAVCTSDIESQLLRLSCVTVLLILCCTHVCVTMHVSCKSLDELRCSKAVFVACYCGRDLLIIIKSDEQPHSRCLQPTTKPYKGSETKATASTHRNSQTPHPPLFPPSLRH